MKKIIGTLLASTIILTGCSSSSTTENKKVEESKKETTFKLGDTLVFEKEAEIVVKTATFTDERNSFEKEQPAKVLLVTYDLKNLSDKDMSIGTEITLYEDGVKAETYPIQVTLNSIGAGRKYENATQAFKVKGNGKLELEVEPLFSLKGKKIIKLDLQ